MNHVNRLDRSIITYTPTSQTNTRGAVQEVFRTYRVVRAGLVRVRGNEEEIETRTTAKRSQRFIVRYDAGFSENMIIEFERKYYDITFIEEVTGDYTRRRAYQIITAVDRNDDPKIEE